MKKRINPKTTSKKAIQGAATCEKILAAAGELFMELGYEGTSMQSIADHCGVTKGALYHHFESKDAIFEAMCASHYAGQAEVFLPIVTGRTAPALQRMRQFLMQLRAYEGANRAYFNTYLRMHARQDNSAIMIKGRLKRYRREMYRTYVVPLLVDGLKEEVFSFDVSAEEMALLLLQVEELITEQMTADLVQPVENIDQVLNHHMEWMTFAFARLLGARREDVAAILVPQEGVDHYINITRPSGGK